MQQLLNFMRTSIKQWLSRSLVVGTAIAMLAPAFPAFAASPTLMKDTMTRQKISTSSAHVVSMTLPGSGITPANTGAITITYTGFGNLATTPDVVCGTGSATASLATTVLTITSGSTACSGTLVVGGVTPFTSTNPGTAGSKTITIATSAGTGGISGTFAVPIVDDDQVTVTATVDPSITFDLDTATTDTESAAPYTVALGTITTADGRVSGTTDSINFIWADLNTNASSGAVVTVKSLNGANGLDSTSVAGDKIPSSTATQANGTANYGICVVSVAQTTGGPLTKTSPFASTCAANSETNSVGGLTTSAQSILGTTSLPIAGGRAQIAVNAAISGVTVAHTDYTDTLTFIATGTF